MFSKIYRYFWGFSTRGKAASKLHLGVSMPVVIHRDGSRIFRTSVKKNVRIGRGQRWAWSTQNNYYDVIRRWIYRIFPYVKCDLVFGKMTVSPNIRAYQHA
jgi:hypothetical protein